MQQDITSVAWLSFGVFLDLLFLLKFMYWLLNNFLHKIFLYQAITKESKFKQLGIFNDY